MMERSIQNLGRAVKERMDLDSISGLLCTPFEPLTTFVLAQNSGLYIDTPSSFSTAIRIGNEMRYPFVEACIYNFDGKPSLPPLPSPAT